MHIQFTYLPTLNCDVWWHLVTLVCNHHRYLSFRTFSLSRRGTSYFPFSPPPPPAPRDYRLLSVSAPSPVLRVLYGWGPAGCGLGVWPLALSAVILRLSRALGISTRFLFMVKLCCIVWVGHTSSVPSPADEHLTVFHLVFLTNRAVRDVCGLVRSCGFWVS